MGTNTRLLAKGVRSNMKDPAGQEIIRLWGELPVIDAKKDLRVFMVPEDISKATRKSPGYCVFAQACRRQFHAGKVMFWRSVAYVELPDEKGRRHVERFMMPDSMRELIEAFDRGEGVIPAGGFELIAPTRGRSLARKVEKEKEARSRKRTKRPQILGTSIGIGKGKGKFRDKPISIDMSVRNGSGAVHFNKRTESSR